MAFQKGHQMNLGRKRPDMVDNKFRVGIKHTKEHKNKLSLIAKERGFGKWMIGRDGTFKGKTHSIKTKENMSMVRKQYFLNGGKIWNAGTKGLMKAWNKGKRIFHMSGENHYNWKGGVASLQGKIRQCLEIRTWTRKILERDFFTCKWCKTKGGKLSADHIRMFARILRDNNVKTVDDARSCKELLDLNNGQTLCENCHSWKTRMDKHIYTGQVPALNIIYNL